MTISPTTISPTTTISLFFFSSGESGGGEKYAGIIEAAQFADRHGFEAVWVPERHFMEIGCLYPSPAILIAALSRETHRVALRAGSVVLPLHNAIRVAEEWSMLDNLSGGRVGIACASGWQPDDFVLAPGGYETRREDVDAALERIKRLWRGDTLQLPRGDGALADVKLYPTPLTRALPTWLTSAGNPQTFAAAGRIGANVLTYGALFDMDGLAERVQLYRHTLRENGFDPAEHKVTVWLQACVGDDGEDVRREAFDALRWYFRSDARRLFAGLVAHHTKRDAGTIAEADFDSYVELLCHRLVENGMLVVGTPAECRKTLERLRASGADEVACQVDFGLSAARQLGTLEQLATLIDTQHSTPRRAESEIETALRRCSEELDVEEFYAALRTAGFEYGPSFRRLARIHRRDGEAVVRVAAASHETQPADAALLDASLHAIFAALPAAAGYGRSDFRVASIEAYEGNGGLPAEFRSHVTIRTASRESIVADVALYDDAGVRVAAFERVTIAAAGEAAPATGLEYDVQWQRRERESRAWNGVPVAVVGDDGRDLVRALEAAGAVVTSDAREAGVLVMFPPPPIAIDGAALADRCARAIALVNQCAAAKDARLWLVTRAAIAASDGDDVQPLDAPLWGIARTAMLEHPELACSIVDLPARPHRDDVVALAELIAAGSDSPQLVIRAGVVHEPRLTRIGSERRAHFSVASDATVLITGATAALTLPVARFLADRGCRRLLLAGRRAPDAEVLRELALLGLDVRVETLDVTHRDDVQQLVARHESGGFPIRGIVHLAAASADALLMNADSVTLARALGAKAIGAWNLHLATAALPLDFFVLFSSAAALLGSAGQGSYAAANAFLDALAAMRRARGLVATSIQFGPWAARGMAARSSAATLNRWSADGLASLDDAPALAALGSALESGRATTLVLAADWNAFSATVPRRQASFFAKLFDTVNDRAPELLASLDGASPADRRRFLDDYLRREVAETLALTDAIDRDLPLQDLGLDSLMALVLKNRIAADLQVDLPVRVLLDGASLAVLLDHLDSAIERAAPEPAKALAAATAVRVTHEDAERILANVDQLSDAEVEQLLARVLMEETEQADAGRI